MDWPAVYHSATPSLAKATTSHVGADMTIGEQCWVPLIRFGDQAWILRCDVIRGESILCDACHNFALRSIGLCQVTDRPFE